MPALSRQPERLAPRRVVVIAELRGVQKDAQDLRVSGCRPSRESVQAGEHHDAAHQRSEEVESGCPHDDGEEEQLPLGAQIVREWLIDL